MCGWVVLIAILVSCFWLYWSCYNRGETKSYGSNLGRCWVIWFSWCHFKKRQNTQLHIEQNQQKYSRETNRKCIFSLLRAILRLSIEEEVATVIFQWQSNLPTSDLKAGPPASTCLHFQFVAVKRRCKMQTNKDKIFASSFHECEYLHDSIKRQSVSLGLYVLLQDLNRNATDFESLWQLVSRKDVFSPTVAVGHW